ncbi:MAG: phosphotransferase [Eubacteriales bacterium]|nr:phosphotransferase [Eubacteriales bacterium]
MDIKILSKEAIRKGWSNDQKFHVTDEKGKSYLLRISDLERYERKQAEFNRMKEVAVLDIPMPLPIEFGIYEDEVYSIQSWIDGKDLKDVILTFSDAKQYRYGVAAGQILKKIHSIPAPKSQEDWEIRFNRKMDRKIQIYMECPIKYEKGEAFVNYINENRQLIKNRPQTYQHGDYHIGNMMIDNNGKLYIIDFDRDDYGDPWEEFNRIVWSAQKSPFFATGIVDGYFKHEVPLEFWRLLALYISSNSLSALPWALQFGDEEIANIKRQAQDVLSWYSNMKKIVPTWYCENYLEQA